MRNESILVSNGIFAAVYMAVAFSSLRLFATLNASASPVWPPTGLAIAALLIWGPRLWPGIYIGAFAANSLTSGPITSIAIAAGNTLEAFMAFWLVVRFAHGVHAFNGARSLGVFVLAAGLAAPLVSATVGTTSLAADGSVVPIRCGMDDLVARRRVRSSHRSTSNYIVCPPSQASACRWSS